MPEQAHHTVEPPHQAYSPAADIKNLKGSYAKRYPALGIFSIILKISGWVALIGLPLIFTVVAMIPGLLDIDQPGFNVSVEMSVPAAIFGGLLAGIFILLNNYVMANICDFLRDAEREKRMQTDILLRLLNKR